MSVKNRLNSKCGIQVHFSDNYEYYLSNSRYVNKTDNEVAHSLNHPQGLFFTSSPQTKAHSRASKEASRRRRAERSESSTSRKRAKRLSNFNVSEITKTE